jgi:hypothetical protein
VAPQARRVESDPARADLAAQRAVLRLERSVAAEQRAQALALGGVLLEPERELALDDREPLAATRAWNALWPESSGSAVRSMKSRTAAISCTALGRSCT